MTTPTPSPDVRELARTALRDAESIDGCVPCLIADNHDGHPCWPHLVDAVLAAVSRPLYAEADRLDGTESGYNHAVAVGMRAAARMLHSIAGNPPYPAAPLDTGTQYAGLTEVERAAAMVDPHMQACDSPTIDEYRLVSAGTLYCCAPCAVAWESVPRWDITDQHSDGCDQRDVKRRPAGKES